MNALLLILCLLLAAMMGAAVLAYKLFGAWGFVGVVAALFFGLVVAKRLVPWALKRALLTPFRMKSAVLAGADAVVHVVVPASPPDGYDAEAAIDDERSHAAGDEDDVDEDAYEDDGEDVFEGDDGEHDGPRSWYSIDVTITPREPTTRFRHWEPGELCLVDHEARSVDPERDEAADDHELCDVDQVEIWHAGRWNEDEAYKYEGPLRLRLLVGVPEGTRKAKFRYYFEVFGEIDLPEGQTLS